MGLYEIEALFIRVFSAVRNQQILQVKCLQRFNFQKVLIFPQLYGCCMINIFPQKKLRNQLASVDSGSVGILLLQTFVLLLQNFLITILPPFLGNCCNTCCSTCSDMALWYQGQEWKAIDVVSNWSLKALVASISLPWQNVIVDIVLYLQTMQNFEQVVSPCCLLPTCLYITSVLFRIQPLCH